MLNFMDRILIGLLGVQLGIVMMIYRYQLKQFTGDIAFAEEYLGSGGTYTLFVLIGLGVSILSIMYALGTLQGFFIGSLGGFFAVGA